jgi:hypothetical protein
MRHAGRIKCPTDTTVAIKQNTAANTFAAIGEAFDGFGGGVLGMTVIAEVINGSFGQQNAHN